MLTERGVTTTGLTITAVCKWYHRRAVEVLIYADEPVTKAGWPLIPDGRRRVLREWGEVQRHLQHPCRATRRTRHHP
ncbi:hypothetical protein ACFQ07_15370 [Actinomadura adrarensis]|uniref:Uncharacterized protein n=1 Tax=Actinomadura adrarensis TaxID=1819600 RepID=A0ABW3CGV6_9ACTN